MAASDYSKVTVSIYGQDYTVGSAETKDRIIKIAGHVDEVMRELAAKGAGGSASSLAMLAAVNITGEMFAVRDESADALRERDQMGKDIVHYQQLWEEAKRTHHQHAEDAKAVQAQKDALQERLNTKTIENDNMLRAIEERDAAIKRLEAELENTNTRLRSATNMSEDSIDKIREMQDKLKEIESNYFELQMENIQMKGELERFKSSVL